MEPDWAALIATTEADEVAWDIGTQVCDEECPPGCEPANKCRLDTYDDHRACVECWLLYMARAAGVGLPEGTVRA